MKNRLLIFLNLLLIILLFMLLAWRHSGQVWGHDFQKQELSADAAVSLEQLEWIRSLIPGAEMVSGGKILDGDHHPAGFYRFTRPCAPEVRGYAGPVPLLIVLDRENRVLGIRLLENQETPAFIDLVRDSGLLKRWDRLTAARGLEQPVDAVSGATYSSRAIIASVRAGLAAQAQVELPAEKPGIPWSGRQTAGLLAVAGALCCLFFKVKNGRIRRLQLLANLILLGMSAGAFVSLSSILGLVSGGAGRQNFGLVPLLILLAMVLPVVFGKKIYCVWFCPLGSAQELLGQIRVRKFRVPRILNHLRGFLGTVLLVLWCLNLGWTALDFELFPGLIWGTAQLVLRIGVILILILSVWIPRPYCRFLCPTGLILDFLATPKHFRTRRS